MQSTYGKIQYYTIGQTEKSSLIVKLKTFFIPNNRVRTVYLFGSVTRRSRVGDVDGAIEAEPELSFKELLDLNA
jgi:predicted nucleotidyltransferase